MYFGGMANLQLGRVNTAETLLRASIESDKTTSHPLVGLAQLYWKTGNENGARVILRQLMSNDSTTYLAPCDVAEVLAVFGDEEGCITWLHRAVDERCAELAGLRMDPMYDSMRNNAEFRHIEALVFGDA